MSSILDRLNPTKKKKEVMNISLLDYTFKDEIVERETPGTLFCKKHDGFTPIIFKSGPKWTGNIFRWISVEALGLVHHVDTKGQKKDVSVIDYLKDVWGTKGYDGLPDALKQKLQTPIAITVTITPIEPDVETQGILNKLKAKSHLYDQNIENTKQLGKSEIKQKWSDVAYNDLWKVGSGIGVCLILQALGVLSGVA